LQLKSLVMSSGTSSIIYISFKNIFTLHVNIRRTIVAATYNSPQSFAVITLYSNCDRVIHCLVSNNCGVGRSANVITCSFKLHDQQTGGGCWTPNLCSRLLLISEKQQTCDVDWAI
jgi:hypothetical protein